MDFDGFLWFSELFRNHLVKLYCAKDEQGDLRLVHSQNWTPQTSDGWISKTLQVSPFRDPDSNLVFVASRQRKRLENGSTRLILGCGGAPRTRRA